MRALIQRVKKSNLSVKGREHCAIGAGLVVFLGVGKDDDESDARLLADKTANLRIFSNTEGKFDLSLLDIKGEALVVSQFTLYGDASKGRRPDFGSAARPEKAMPLYEHFHLCLKGLGIAVKTGVFAAEMEVALVNDGPVTIWLDSKSRV
ncbi:MAG: D-tyrosyl-tRNA(Tyr) deacylase [Elusimicrobia bacterium GWC2_51_8]|nr:MAG: D-tyrosyl-tRNA(Tyr) deacylase [Elusimicrobia bacterium GWA2_51_34]OGR62320.1 MAG: D-tyrosyl-tRNA(Tyr) deacylase [Elusimicrobia bacterium GWC2_51_8]OGR86902.1 MAG: D-tyrosyl-tRNA(Tyr) deacylase [Elusimicrobia bacterium GWF2_52_66]HAF94705.1 D-tyrosyl-tRNA(Tyr) deacylase [Elusimicrobiota bacterium]HCE98425.1 D-tyrosyl-tRNA(Tyr) deacylase [Elusimicrobiota bacterium]